MDKLMLDLLSAWNSHDTSLLAALYSEDFEGQDIGEPTPQQGPSGVVQSFSRYLRAFPDIAFCAEESIQAGDRTVLVWSAQGTHLGPLMNIPATGRPIVLRGVSVFTVKAGKISRALHLWDMAGVLRMMMLLPEL
jgi:steroid delta-isomerase-like uncharacterized protein